MLEEKETIFSEPTFCKITNNFSWNSMDFKFGHFKIFDEFIFQFWEHFFRHVSQSWYCETTSVWMYQSWLCCPFWFTALFSWVAVVKIIRLSLLFFIFWRIFKHFSVEMSNRYHHSILGLRDKLCCHSLPKIGILG